MKQRPIKFPHVEYFLALEADLQTISRYVEISEANYKTYSIELDRLLLAIGAEIDTVAKAICLRLSPDRKIHNMGTCRSIICGKYPHIIDITVALPRYGIEIVPWSQWRAGRAPDWWDAFTRIKHQRGESYADANLNHVLRSLAALYVLLIYLYPKGFALREFDREPVIFALHRQYGGGRFVFGDPYNIPDLTQNDLLGR